jgi:hypothetical protein
MVFAPHQLVFRSILVTTVPKRNLIVLSLLGSTSKNAINAMGGKRYGQVRLVLFVLQNCGDFAARENVNSSASLPLRQDGQRQHH